MEAAAFVSCRDVGQMMSSLDRELLENVHGYLLGDSQLLVRLQTQLPLGVSQAVLQRKPGIRMPFWSVHRLQKKVAEHQGKVPVRFGPVLAVDGLSFITTVQDQFVGCAAA